MPLNADNMPNLGITPTSSEIILTYIRDAISSGELEEGEPIRQDEVARVFNVSKIPVREALKRLEAEGLVEFHRNRGAIVTSLSEPEIVQIFEVRATLEAKALKLSVPNMTDASLERITAACDAFENQHDVYPAAKLNWEFHLALYEDAGRPFWITMIRLVNDRIERYLRAQLTLSDGLSRAAHDHREIMSAVRARNADLAGQLMYDHIMNACDSLIRNLPAKRKV